MRVRPTAPVSGWMHSVAEVLPLQDGGGPPYSLGEAVAELGAYAEASSANSWERSRPAQANRASLRNEIIAQREAIGSRVAGSVSSLLDDVVGADDRGAVAAAARRFYDVWHSKALIIEGFRDLCDAARESGATSKSLRKLSTLIASQIGASANGSFSVLKTAADALVSSDEDLIWMRNWPESEPATETQRLEMAERDLTHSQSGNVVVWFSYYRAVLQEMRTTLGRITFLQADWALPNAFGDGRNDFPERSELQTIRQDASWLDVASDEARNTENRIVLVRVDLGQRELAGAHEAARRQIEAMLSIAIKVGGSTWRSSGTFSVLLDGQVRYSSFAAKQRNEHVADAYGMGATAEVLDDVARQLGGVLELRPLPEPLIEAFVTMREARVSDHRDVFFQNLRPTTPRVATALEDHAMELIASALGVEPKRLSMALRTRETISRTSIQVAQQIMAPFDSPSGWEQMDLRRSLQRRITDSATGHRTVSVTKVAALKSEILSLRMSDIQRSDLREAIGICTDPMQERRMLHDVEQDVELLRARLRRVRNAVNHGLPLAPGTLASIRDYATETSTVALDLSLTWFKGERSGPSMIQCEIDAWSDRLARIDRGESWATYEARVQNEIRSRDSDPV